MGNCQMSHCYSTYNRQHKYAILSRVDHQQEAAMWQQRSSLLLEGTADDSSLRRICETRAKPDCETKLKRKETREIPACAPTRYVSPRARIIRDP
eukprot:6214508-Pleurochrysis_carterae.AAC.1